MKDATKLLAGSMYISWAPATCCTTPLTHQHDLIRDAHGLFLIVGNKDGGHLGFLLDTANF